MINTIPQQMSYAQPSTTNAVNIQIFNPTANTVGQATYPMPNQIAMPMGYSQTHSLYAQNNGTHNAQFPQNYNNALMNKKEVAPELAKTADAKTEAPAEQKPEGKKQTVPLTDEYIMSLENYLNNSNARIRIMAAKELLERFKEDETRNCDVALTALLNKVIQDPIASVRFVGLTALDVGYAKGDDLTVQILKQMQQQPAEQYGEDALLASQILLKMSAQQGV
ncbi:MAG: hypothetical protein E7Z91_02490 [Cyanobacteria bacterium SIG30]|nr:hypothetical protein [Cyanobacteria bacterium SIG30]